MAAKMLRLSHPAGTGMKSAGEASSMVDLEVVLQSRDRAQQRFGLRDEPYVHSDRRLPPTEKDRRGATGQVAGPLPVGRVPEPPHEATDSGGVG